MKLKALIGKLEFESIENFFDFEIGSIELDSRKCLDSSLFIAVKGYESDGHKFIEKAIEKGAKAVVFQDKDYSRLTQAYPSVCFLRCSNSRSIVGALANNFYMHPSDRIKLVGVTGTNGKTTTATLLYRLYRSMGYCSGLISTIANYVEDKEYPTINTTPDILSTYALLNEMIEAGCEYCFMEVSSHALDQGRVDGLNFSVAIFSNLTHDHLDYHKTFIEYLNCKKRLFDSLPSSSYALVNVDDKNGRVMTQNTAAQIYTYSCERAANFKVKIIESTLEGSLLNIDGTEVWTRFIGRYNAQNLLAVYSTAILLGAEKEEVLVGISELSAVSGRFEYIRGGKGLTAVIDYAHTPDALENILLTIRDIASSRQVICIFGCGGDRDKTKRPKMGAIAAKYSDRVFITSDNPRFEDPQEIIKDVQAGISPSMSSKVLSITDRRDAIRTAILTASEGSIIIVAGKGHEDYQIINGEKSHFDDKLIVQDCFNTL